MVGVVARALTKKVPSLSRNLPHLNPDIHSDPIIITKSTSPQPRNPFRSHHYHEIYLTSTPKSIQIRITKLSGRPRLIHPIHTLKRDIHSHPKHETFRTSAPAGRGVPSVPSTLVLEPDPDPAHLTRWRELQALYGSRVIPDQAVELLHGGPPGALG